ncbi:MAG: TraB/GumN family protein [Bacteroidaceae bacterium]|nr:TraB/GumN family protein [Bacteroidaceae bacterium]
MKASTLLFTFVCCLAFLSCSSQPTKNKEESQPTKNRKKENSILWEISGKGLTQKSYLLGTHHIVNYHFLDSIPQFQSIINNVDAIAVEHDGEAFAKSALQAFFEAKNNKIPSHVFMPEGVKSDCSIYASEEEYYYVDRFIREYKKEQNAANFNHEELRPIYTMMILQSYYRFMGMMERTFDSSLPVNFVQMDKGIEDEARKRKKRLLYLETLEDRSDEKEDSLYIDTCNLTRQSRLLYLTCKNLASQKENKRKAVKTAQTHTNKQIELYKNGEIDSLYKSVETMASLPSDISDDYQRKGLYNMVSGRNKKWIPVIKSNIQECPCLIAVGAGHLPGKEGLINLIRKEGYTVKPVDIYEK